MEICIQLVLLEHIHIQCVFYFFLACLCQTQQSLTFQKVEDDLLQHGSVDLWVSDGVQQPPLLLAGKDELAELLPVNLAVLQEDLRPEVVDDSGVGPRVRLHDCSPAKRTERKIRDYSLAWRSISLVHSVLNKTNTAKAIQHF